MTLTPETVPPTDSGLPTDAGNPFSTRYTRPGAIAFRFPPTFSAEGLVQRLRAQGWNGAIVGPHGSGKSSLLAVLVPAIRATGKSVLLIELHDGQRRLPIRLQRRGDLHAGSVLVIDGFEQLSRLARWSLDRFRRSRQIGLVVTSHRPAGLPELYRTSTSVALAGEIVESLLAGQGRCISPEELAERYHARGGDLRETLFDLYDLYEQRRSSQHGQNL